MKAKTAISRIEKSYKGSKTGQGYRVVLDLLTGVNNTYMVRPGGLIRPVRLSGSGRFTKNLNYTADVCRVLDIAGIRYTVGNDAPRGGETGTFIRIVSKIEL